MRNAHLYVLFVLLFGGAAFLAVTQTSPLELWARFIAPSYAYSLSENGVLFASNDAPIPESLEFIRRQESFVLSPVGLEANGTLNGLVGEALIQQQIILGGNQKFTMTVIRVYDAPGQTWLGCQTDYGTAKESVFIPVPECQVLLSPSNSFVFFTEFPDASRDR
ncbi:MAG: hypothetical protein AABW68_00095, partial [archaeon]